VRVLEQLDDRPGLESPDLTTSVVADLLPGLHLGDVVLRDGAEHHSSSSVLSLSSGVGGNSAACRRCELSSARKASPCCTLNGRERGRGENLDVECFDALYAFTASSKIWPHNRSLSMLFAVIGVLTTCTALSALPLP
jgi:hypothetical protein